MKPLPIFTVFAAACIGTGCQNLVQPSRGYTDLTKSQIKSTDAISQSVQSLELSVTKNKKESEDRINQLEKDAALRQAELNDAVTRINTANKKYEDLLTGLAGAASKTFTGTDLGSVAVKSLFNAIDCQINTAVTSQATAQATATDNKIAEAKTTAATAASSAKSQAVEEVKTQFPLIASQHGLGPEKIQQLQTKTDQLGAKTTADTTGLIGGAIAALLGGGALAKQNASIKAKQDQHEAKLKQVDEHDDKLLDLDKRMALNEVKSVKVQS